MSIADFGFMTLAYFKGQRRARRYNSKLDFSVSNASCLSICCSCVMISAASFFTDFESEVKALAGVYATHVFDCAERRKTTKGHPLQQ